ncbi:sulfotransferase family 2 domain-containing protein [Winogradskyella psychrotolerans]|uniref:sulfotransferase family 2 domain-containing protein n=1 Tax=Winogradskyella psychrotolerans TaxID=1344585 RepID=UPI001C06C9FC|nr:sulfotransferase family 2 domain-containing protein [Winogradskyella psychrotolerans]MBU2929555.1 sulfotransferase family protein [Winogradskyella psychrotolerans]
MKKTIGSYLNMRAPNKENLIFLHLPKNGGMTFNRLLDRLYSKDRVFQIRVKSNSELTTQEFIDLPECERAKIDVLKGHMYYGLHKHMTGDSKYITFLRHPEKRLLSFYNFVKARPSHRLYNTITKNNMSFHDFVENIEASDVNNAQVRLISGLKHGDPNTMLETAMLNINEHFSFVGLQENYNESLVLLKIKYGWGIPYYHYKNKTKSEHAVKTINEKTRALIATKNAADIALYNYYKKELTEKLKSEKSLKKELLKLNFANKLTQSVWGRRALKLLKV